MTEDTKTKLAQRASAGVTAGKTIADYLSDPRTKNELARAAANHLDADRLARLALSLSRQPGLKECTPQSILSCVMQSAQLGLEPVLGRCYYVPYFNKRLGAKEATFILGYQGMLDLARRSGEVKMIYAEVVFEKDEFRYQYGLNPDLYHVPGTGDRGPKIGVYAVARYKDEGFNFVYMTEAEVNKIKARSASATSGRESPWDSDEEAMWKKTAIKALRPYLPMQVMAQWVVDTTPGQLRPLDFDEVVECDADGVVMEEEATEEAE